MREGSPAPVVDIHSHFFPEGWPDLGERLGGDAWPWMRHLGDGRAVVMLGDKEFRPVYSACWDADKRLEEMDRDGIDLQIFCSTPVLFAYDRRARQAADCARLFNDAALELVAKEPRRFGALCQVPLQDTDLACKELTRAMRDGHLGVQIGNHVGDKSLEDEGIIAFLQHCADEGAAVLVHPWDMAVSERMRKYMLPWLVGLPAETQLSILSLILSGGIERLPESLRICFAHGGGSFAYLLGRADNAWRERDIVWEDCPRPPSDYVGRFFADAAVVAERALRLLVDVMGAERVMFGTDYPFPLGERRMGSLVRESAELSPEQKGLILGANALDFFGIEWPAGTGIRPDTPQDTLQSTPPRRSIHETAP